jgi:hypothetical protein
MPVSENYKQSDTKAESKHLRAEDYDLDKKWRLTVEDVTMEMMPARDGKPARNRLILLFVGKEKGLVLNATNQGFMEARMGIHPNGWIGASVVLHRTTTVYGEKTVPAFRLIEAKKGVSRPVPPPPPIEVDPLPEDVDDFDDGGDPSVPF